MEWPGPLFNEDYHEPETGTDMKYIDSPHRKVIHFYDLPLDAQIMLRETHVVYKGFTATVQSLLANGWDVTVEINKVTKKRWLYLRHYEYRLICRMVLPQDWSKTTAYELFDLDFIMQEHNGRVKARKTQIWDNQLHFEVDADTPQRLMEAATDLMKADLKPEPEKPKPLAEVIEIVRKRA